MVPNNEHIALLLFYNQSNGVQSRLAFSQEFRHCNVITYDGRDWIMLDFDKTGLLTRRIYVSNALDLIRHAKSLKSVTAIVTVMIKERAITRWTPWWVRSCNEVSRYASGLDIGFTFNPTHLYRKLLKYKDRSNYEILNAWRRKDGILWGRQRSRSSRQLGGSRDNAESSGVGAEERESV